mmetsp:Transcript_47975/g.103927  ORF Transcript_47975/g.103927 Transcript_47975/m.103927 type:complete len:364 (-) Transcript_47975:125-1216(-)
MDEMQWKVTLDTHSSEPDLALSKMGKKFMLTVGKDYASFKPIGCCAGGKPYVLPLDQVKEVKMVTANWSAPSLVIVGEKVVEDEAVKFFHKVFVDGNEPAIEECCNKMDAQIRLLSGQVLVAGYIDPSIPNLITWFSPADTTKIFELESAMLISSVNDKKTLDIKEYDGTITFTRLTYGMEMLFSKEGMEIPCSVFCERVHTIQFELPVVEETLTTGEGEVVKAFRLKAAAKDANSKGTWAVLLEPRIVLSAPYLAGLKGRPGAGAARPRVTSFSLPIPRFGKKKNSKAAKPAPAPAPPPVDADGEGEAAPADAPPAPSPRGGLFSSIKRKASMTLGKTVDPPAADADADADAEDEAADKPAK